MLDMKERDLSLVDKSSVSEPVFDSVWGNFFEEDEANDILLCNIIIPEAYWSMINYDNGEFSCRFKASYMPDARNFRIRLVALRAGVYSLFGNIRGEMGIQVSSYALSKNIAAPISASMLPFIDIDGNYLIKFAKSAVNEVLDKAYIYSAKKTDIMVDFSDDQASQLLSLCGPGKSYRYPTTGVGITKYLNAVIAHSDLLEVLEEQFMLDNKPIEEADFDNLTGGLQVVSRPEMETTDTGLENISNLNREFFTRFTDDFVRRNTVLNEVGDNDFISSLNNYNRFLAILLFKDSSTTATRINDRIQEGRFDGEGKIIPDSDYFIVSATLEPNTVIMFDDELEDSVSDAPVFIVNDNDETRLYTSLVEQVYWVSERCHKCFVLKKRSVVSYMIRKSQFQNDKGLYIIPQTSDNIKNMLGLVQDDITGRLLGVVSSSTNISDMTLDEVTQYIYATHLTD